MNNLSFHGLLSEIEASKPVSACISAVKEGKFPLEITGFEGALGALLLAGIFSAQKGVYFAVVPTENEAAELAMNLSESGIPCQRFPVCGALPYRGLASHSAVFGQRVKVLSDIIQSRHCVIIIVQRAFLTPLPPPQYLSSLLIFLKQGGTIDTVSLAGTLTEYGYTRVPRVQVHGEFALRGEVLDIYMGGDDDVSQAAEAYRVLFDFDRVESIKRFDPLMQGSMSGQAVLPELTIRPLREVVWTDDRIESLEKNLCACKEFSDGGRAVIEELIARRSIPGEEMFYPLAFDSTDGGHSILDYSVGGILVLFGRERMENAQENLESEYRGMYARSTKENKANTQESEKRFQYPLPQRLLLNFRNLLQDQKRLVSFKFSSNNYSADAFNVSVPCEPSRSFFGNIDYLKDEFKSLYAG
jgi:transcription-repair coupling factor (superfamily II helicase)